MRLNRKSNQFKYIQFKLRTKIRIQLLNIKFSLLNSCALRVEGWREGWREGIEREKTKLGGQGGG